VVEALKMLDDQGRISVKDHQGQRFKFIAEEVLNNPAKTLVVSPDNRSRLAIGHVIREARQEAGQMTENIFRSRILNQRSDMAQADIGIAAKYNVDDVIRYGRAASIGFKAGDYASVLTIDRDANKLTVMRESDGKVFTYDPSRVATQAEVYEPTHRQFAIGERVQFTKQWKEYIAPVGRAKGQGVVHAANRALGTIERLDSAGNVTVKLVTPEGKPEKRLAWNLEKMPHLDYGYAMTSYSAQGATTDKVIVHIDTDAPNVQKMLSQQLLYVAASRGKQDVRLVVNDREELDRFLSRRPENATALAPEEVAGYQMKATR
jgi:hypothetical protein